MKNFQMILGIVIGTIIGGLALRFFFPDIDPMVIASLAAGSAGGIYFGRTSLAINKNK